MATALIKGFVSSGLVSATNVVVSAPSDRNLAYHRDLGCHTTHNNVEVIEKAAIVFFAVKPHLFPVVMKNLKENCQLNEKPITTESKLYVSIMAGIKMNTLLEDLKTVVEGARIIRVHNNTPAMVGAGCSVFSTGEGATKEDAKVVTDLLSSVGLCERVPESQQDAFTGMAGSGPAYIYTIIEALSDGGVRQGLPRELATKFAAQMTMGAAKMVLESGKHPGQLKDEVTSPGGTTIRALHVMEKAGIRGIMMDAVQASAERATELGTK